MPRMLCLPLSCSKGPFGLFSSAGDNFSRVELDQHVGIGFQVFHRNGESEVIEYKELQFEMVQFRQGKSSDL